MTRASIGRLVPVLALAAALMGTAGCGELARTGRAPAFLIMERLQARSGSTGEIADSLSSDVQTIVEQQIGGQTVRVPTVFADSGTASIRLGLKDPGTVAAPTTPSPLAQVTIYRYRVTFVRSDGRNTPGVDVPYGMDGAVTATISGTTAATTVSFPLVTHAMKFEPPLRQLIGLGGQAFIHTLAEITFYGRDQAGNEVSVNGFMTVNFGDFADPD
ncbi:MAG: hypothetical protein Q8L86_06225 [Vicinamibacterales bacterium]|nr:hypothetical protein [Vicinamibacterales bacterium]